MRADHLTDRDIILLVDGELRSGASEATEHEAKKHLEACWSCRSRMAEIQGTITAFVHTYHGSLDAQLTPAVGPRARLQAQLKHYAESQSQTSRWWNLLLAGRRTASAALMAASLIVACLVVLTIYARGTARRTGDLAIPRNSLTPGETRNVTIADVCGATQTATQADIARAVPVSLRRQVFREYGINDMRPNAYEVDYLITPELGGSNSIRNLWPQPYSAVWNAHVKDELEDRLHGLVCAGEVDLTTAQRELASDWIGAYKKYFHTDKPF
jgi:hypothetical protein